MNAQQRRQLEPLLLNAVRETGRELGRGAYGVVTEVIVSETVCAAKKLHEAIVQDYTMTKFSDEVVLHSQQRHPNIVQLMGVYYPPRSQLPMLIMEYLPFSLTQCLEKEELPLQMKYCILLDVAKGMCYLHGKCPPIVHRDLTANNVLLTSSYTAKVSDLGVSRLADTFKKQHLTTAPGNAMVMPPEALKDNPVYDHKLDVFSYGCLILHVLTGQFPEPTNQFIPGKGESYRKVPEWDRRLKYIQQIPKENELLPLARQCLNDVSSGRPEMIKCHQFVEQVLLKYPKTRSAIELIREKEARERELQSLAKQNKALQAEKSASKHKVETLKKEKESAVACAKVLESELKLKESEFNEALMSKEKQIIKLQKDMDCLLTAKKEYDASISKINAEYEEIVSKLLENKLMLSDLIKNQPSGMAASKSISSNEDVVDSATKKHGYVDEAVIVRQEYNETGEFPVEGLTEHEQVDKEAEYACNEISIEVVANENEGELAFMSQTSAIIPLAVKSKNETISFLMSRASVVIPSYQTQKELTQPLLTQRLKKGDKRYLVDQKWLKQWKKYTGFDSKDQHSAGETSSHPGPINTHNLFKGSQFEELRDHLMEELHYALLPEPAWTLLVSWYGLSAESRPIARYVVEYGSYVKHLRVEVFKLELKLCVHPNINDYKTHSFSRADTINDILTVIKERYSIPDTTVCRLWKRYMTNSYQLLTNLQQTVADAGIYGGQTVVLEMRNPNGTWPREQKLRQKR